MLVSFISLPPHRLISLSRPRPAGCNELFGTADAAWAGFLLAHVTGRILWAQDRLSARATGVPSPLGIDHPLLLMRLSHPRDVLTAAEEALACRDLGGVVAEIHGNPSALNFTATRRLAVRAEASGVPFWLVRHAAGAPEASAMRDRWRVTALPAGPHPDDPSAPGDPCWRVELFRSRDKRPGLWAVRHERASNLGWSTDHLHFAPLLSDREVAADAGDDRGRAAR